MLRPQTRPALRVAISHDYRTPVSPELAGGDVIALNRHDDGSTTLLIGDLSAKGGEGVAFASWMATLFHISSAVGCLPSNVLQQMNRLLSDVFAIRQWGYSRARLFAAPFPTTAALSILAPVPSRRFCFASPARTQP